MERCVVLTSPVQSHLFPSTKVMQVRAHLLTNCFREKQLAVDVSALKTDLKNVSKLVALIGIEVVYGIGIVPEDPEIVCRGVHFSKAAHRFVGIGYSLGI